MLPRGQCHHLCGIAGLDLCHQEASTIAYLGLLRWICATTWPVPWLTWDRWFGSVPPCGQCHRLLGIAEVDLCHHMASGQVNNLEEPNQLEEDCQAARLTRLQLQGLHHICVFVFLVVQEELLTNTVLVH